MGMFFTKKIADIRLDLDNHDKQQASTDRVSNGIKTDSLLFKLSSVSRSARPGSNIQWEVLWLGSNSHEAIVGLFRCSPSNHQ